ncbi:PREDICTED: uncharacterized protein LOC109221304 [Nicotiana attenuata]|uniref:uncharacterized protein LOC109221304 n=1 Tax=Nicotiana attenuata TaxID=49451 RepID=UPI000905721E|nr:PREDICTED: uncharacterized protein LOC109221304 [Nicotiana attenuata]
MAVYELGMDIVGPLPPAFGPYQKIGEREVVDFLREDIICKFGMPKEIACDNGPQFIGAKLTKFLKDLKIKRIKSSPYHPSANGQAESTNKVIIQNLKKWLEAAKVEVGDPTLRYFQANEETNNEAMLINLELLDERRDLVHIRMVAQNKRMEGKQGPTWEGPYRVSAVTGNGSYELENQNGETLPSH